jgi:hypothetical protein
VTGAQPPAATGSAHGLVWLRRHPAGVVMIWIPGMNAKHCQARRTVGHHRRAGRLARAIDRAPRVSKGTYNCPNDDLTEVDLYFTYRTGGDEFVDVPLAGCRFLSAPDRAARAATQVINHQLKRAAPHHWRRYL